jgi:putative DNA primase/helicase
MQRISHPLTDLKVARLAAERFRGRFRYAPGLGWLLYDGRRWSPASEQDVWVAAREIPTLLEEQARGYPPLTGARRALLEASVRYANRSRLAAVVKLLESEPALRADPAAFDADPWMLNTLNGLLDLRTGSLHPHSPDDFVTRLSLAEYRPDAQAPRFERFLEEVLPDSSVRCFLQRSLGMALAGQNQEQIAVFLTGKGGNGKSTLLRILRNVLGDYVANADLTQLADPDTSRPRPDLLRLRGARLILVAEPKPGALDVSLIKHLTGGDPISARDLWERPVEFRVGGVPIVACNELPKISDLSEGAWRRIRVIEFPVTISPDRQDRTLADKIVTEESAGVLAWLVEGLMAWQREGLASPPQVLFATEDWRSREDPLAEFLVRCDVGDDAESTLSSLYCEYVTWAEGAGERRPLSRRRFLAALQAREGVTVARGRGGVWVRGVGLAPQVPAEPVARYVKVPSRDEKHGPRRRDEVREAQITFTSAVGEEEGERCVSCGGPLPGGRAYFCANCRPLAEEDDHG